MKHTLLTTSALAVALGMSAVTTAAAQDNTVVNGQSGVNLKISGQLNRGVLFVDDGAQNESYFVDNDNSSSRLRVEAGADVGGLTFGTDIIVELESNSTATVNQNNDGDSEFNFAQRRLDVFAEGAFGRVTLGHGNTASDDASEVDLSGTAVVSYSGIADLAGGSLLRLDGGALSTSAIGDAFSNFDGQGRRDRIRYDSPTFGGFGISASIAEGERNDIALTYGGEFGAFDVAAAIAFGEQNDNERINGSISVAHDSGFSVTLAGGEDRVDGAAVDPTFGYIKLGYQTDSLASWGTTAFSVDYYDGDDVLSPGTDSRSYGLAVVQNIDAINTELYAGYRTYEVDGFQDTNALLVGARVRF